MLMHDFSIFMLSFFPLFFMKTSTTYLSDDIFQKCLNFRKNGKQINSNWKDFVSDFRLCRKEISSNTEDLLSTMAALISKTEI